VASWALSGLLIQLTFRVHRAGRPLDGRPLLPAGRPGPAGASTALPGAVDAPGPFRAG
jgi:hypothetical protein